MLIRPIQPEDYNDVWQIFHEVVARGDTYAYDPATSRDEALRLWVDVPRATYVAEAEGEVLGTYYLKTNQPGLGNHVCNAGYMVAGRARGRGLGRAMAEHSLEEARRLGYRAMQYNFVASTNQGAIRLWKRLGFEVVGTLPGAFRHAEQGYIDALVMYRPLT